jgi:5-methylcytosine-specific restriction endonuclease McrA
MVAVNAVDLQAERWCSACKVNHKLWTLNEDGEPVPTFSRNTKHGWQSICKVAATRINVKRQRERRQEQAENDPLWLNDLAVRKAGIVALELRGLRRLGAKFNRPVTVTFDSLMKLFESHNFECIACGSPYLNAAHIIPLEHGGESSIDNIVPLCNTCKIARRYENLDTWMKRKTGRPLNSSTLS